jgi:hypothetical protein
MDAAAKVGHWRGRRLDGGFAVYNKSRGEVFSLGLEKPYDPLVDDQISMAISNAFQDVTTKKQLNPGKYCYHRLI